MTYAPPPASSSGPPQQSPRPEFASALAQPTVYQPPARPPKPVPHLQVQVPPAPVHAHRTALIWLFGILAFMLLALVGYFVAALGVVAAGVGLVLALIPLTIVFIGVHHIDRWEPEPRRLIIFALAWGAIAAVGLTLLADIGITLMLGPRPDEVSAVFQAPIVEEITKCFGVFLVYVIARRSFDGPVDGVVYGALVGAGFAFTENIQYFAVSLIEGGGAELTATFVVRALMSPFAHAMFTALTGYAIGRVARRGGSAASAFGAGCFGLIGAIALHAFWNGSAVYADFWAMYVTLQVPLFIGFILAIVALKREEARLTLERLGDYAKAGWFTPQEVLMLATRDGRKTGLAWAGTLRGDRTRLMKTFIGDATALATNRQRALTGRDDKALDQERLLLARITATRQQLLSY